jgi:hypothetical protein
MEGTKMKNRMLKGVLILGLIAQMMSAGHLVAAVKPPDRKREVSGTVLRKDANLLSLKTKQGNIRNFPFDESQRENFKAVRPGDQVVVKLGEGNHVVNLQIQGSGSDVKPSDPAPSEQ